ncbi:MAG: DUF2157 domain-containing protein [Sphingobacteriales bacterium]|nr:MAG: DUF2157 domain-containing protein [Sphingobacteriales bacterium]
MAKLDLDKQESELLNNVISHWDKEGLLHEGQAEKLREAYHVKGFDWMRLAKYSFWIALTCGFIAVGTFIIDDAVITWLRKLYDTPDIVISLLAGIAAAVLYYIGQKQKSLNPEKLFSNEALTFSGILFTACSIAYLGKAVNNSLGHYSLLFLLAVFVYGFLAWRLKSGLIWLFSLVALGSWFGTETGYQSNWNDYFLGMNYPLRFVIFGAVLVAVCYVLRSKKWFGEFYELTYVLGMLYLFVSLWLLSVFGNYANIDAWWLVSQFKLYYWGLITAAIAGGVLWYGLKSRDVIAREFGITFLLVSVYTKYFEYLWDHVNRTIFFLLLALSFWIIGHYAERIWNLKGKRTAV